MIHSLSDTCTELPQGKHLFTTTKFPVNKGTVLYVKCITGYTKTGDVAITCLNDSEFTSKNKEPNCIIGG